MTASTVVMATSSFVVTAPVLGARSARWAGREGSRSVARKPMATATPTQPAASGAGEPGGGGPNRRPAQIGNGAARIAKYTSPMVPQASRSCTVADWYTPTRRPASGNDTCANLRVYEESRQRLSLLLLLLHRHQRRHPLIRGGFTSA